MPSLLGVQYAIPSRARSDTLGRKTLPLLRRLAIPDACIRVFVSRDEVAAYRAALPATIAVEPGGLGVCANRNAISRFYPEGERVISIDDDLRDLCVRAGEKTLVAINAWEWSNLVAEAFDRCSMTGATLWGLYPVPNPFFMKPRVRTDLCYVAGAVQGLVNRHDLPLDLEYRDDWQRSVLHYLADGLILRHDYVTWKTEGYHGKGGLQTTGERTPDATLRDCRELRARYPDLVTLNLTKKSGWPETRLRDSRKVAA